MRRYTCADSSFRLTGKLHCIVNHSLKPGEEVRFGKAKCLLTQIGLFEIALLDFKTQHGLGQTFTVAFS